MLLHYATATVVVLAVSCVSVFAVNITTTPASNSYVLRPSDKNVTYQCQSDCGTILWRIFQYQMVDRDQYIDEGLVIRNEASGQDSMFHLDSMGRNFLLDQYEEHMLPSQERCRGPQVMDIQCFVLYDVVHVEYGDRYRAIVDDLDVRVETDNGGVTNISWCRPSGIVDASVTLEYTVNIIDMDNIMGNQKPDYKTRNTYYVVPRDFSGENCEISVSYQSVNSGDDMSGDDVPGAGVETIIMASIPNAFDIADIEESLKITRSGSTVTVKFDQPTQKNDNVPIRTYNVTLRNAFTMYPSPSPIPAVGTNPIMVDFTDVDTTSCVYFATVIACTDVSCQSASKILDNSKASNGNVTYFNSFACLSADASSEDTCVQFDFTINGEVKTFQLEGKELEGTIPSTPVAGEEVVYYDCGAPCGVKPAKIKIVDRRNDFPCDIDAP